LLKIARVSSPTSVTFAAANPAAVTGDPGFVGQEFPCRIRISIYTSLYLIVKELTNELPLIMVVLKNGSGGAHLKSPTGACAYGIPRYSDTVESLAAACPVTEPLYVFTVCPIVQLEVSHSLLQALTATAVQKVIRVENFIVNKTSLVGEEERIKCA
jgi:hypothetical protein